MKIVFMGTPAFAVASLAILKEAGYEIAAVVTVPDKPVGRGLKLGASAVKQYAEANQLPVLQPEKLRDVAFVEALKALDADLFVVVAFRMLPEIVWRLPKKGTFNLHASLLPNYRGAAPINWAVANGEKETGVTTFFIDQQIDTGSILLQEKVAIPEEWDAGNLHDTLMEVGAKLVLTTVEGVEAGTLQPSPQDESQILHHAPKIFNEHCKLDWSKSAETVHNLVRGMSPFPTTWTMMNGKHVKVYQTKIGEETDLPAGTVIREDKNKGLKIACADRFVHLLSLQMEGKKRMTPIDFLNGLKEDLHLSEA
ncbi:MAG: methionyl-tRNA formyltransferase [Bacteroidia bacterium]